MQQHSHRSRHRQAYVDARLAYADDVTVFNLVEVKIPTERHCSVIGCEVVLSRYNDADKCFVHQTPRRPNMFDMYHNS